jgi:hypothetical protein
MLLHKGPFLSDNYRLVLFAAVPPRVWELGWVGYVNRISDPDGSNQRYLSHGIMTPQFLNIILYFFILSYDEKDTLSPGVYHHMWRHQKKFSETKYGLDDSCIRLTDVGQPRPTACFPVSLITSTTEYGTVRHSQGRATLPSIQPSNIRRQ